MLWQLVTQSKLYPSLKEHCGSATARALFDLACLCLLDPERFAALLRALGQGAELAGRVKWARALTSEEAARYADWAYVFGLCSDWQPADAPVKP